MKFIIYWDAGYGKNYEEVEAPNLEEAEECAREQCREESETNADFGAEEYTEDLARDYGLLEEEIEEDEDA